MTRGERDRGGFARARALAVLAACALAALLTSAAAGATALDRDGLATESLGNYYYEARFSTLEARPDGGLVAQRQDQLETFLANGAPDPGAPPQKVSGSRRVYPLAAGKSLLVDGRKLTRLNPDGSIDGSFGGGTVLAPFEVEAAAELTSGKVAIAEAIFGGTHTFSSNVHSALVNADGSIERGSESTVSPPINNFGSDIVAIAPRSDGGAILVGSYLLLALRPDGSPDPSFAGGGLVTDLPRLIGGRALPGGGIEMVGSDSFAGGNDLLLARYTAAGTPDGSFGPEGARSFDLGAAETAQTALWGADGSVLVGATSTPKSYCSVLDNCEETPLVAAFDSAGNPDRAFGEAGVARLTPLTAAPDSGSAGGVLALARRPDGSIVAAGGGAPKRTVAFLAALSPQGMLLPGFGEGGIVRERHPVRADQQVVGLASLPGGKLLAAGTTDVGVDDAPALIRYSADGSLDRSFGAGAGYVKLADHYFASAFSVNGSGQTAVAVAGYPNTTLLLRDGAGAPVPSFGNGGVVQLPESMRVATVSLADDGSAIVGGVLDRAGDNDPAVVLRLDPDGTLDPGFGRRGRAFLLPRRLSFMRVDALVRGRGGRILLSGRAGNRFVLCQLLADGRPDAGFGAGGCAIPNGRALAATTLTRAGSRIYLAGADNERELRVDLFRYRADGRLDRGFGRGGRRTAAIAKQASPHSILPSRRGVLVVLSKGARPLLSFEREGRVRRGSLGAHANRAEDVRAVRSGGRLIVGWNALSRAQGRFVYYLSSRPFP